MNELTLYDIDAALPICAVCNKPVDKVESMYSIEYDGKIFKVYCHGKVEQQILGMYTMMNAKEITFGKAFDYKKLESKTSENS